MSNLYSQLGHSTGELHALIVLVVFSAVDWQLASYMLGHFLKIRFKMTVGVQVWHNENTFFTVLILFIWMSWHTVIPHCIRPFYVSNIVIYMPGIPVLFLSLYEGLMLSILVTGNNRSYAWWNFIMQGCSNKFSQINFKLVLVIDGWGNSCEIDLIWISLNHTIDVRLFR